MNKIILQGRLTRNPDIYHGNDVMIARYSIAVPRPYASEKTDFIDCKCFGNKAEFANKYLRVGMKILVCGSLVTGSYTNKNGDNVRTSEVIVDEHHFCEKKGEYEDVVTETNNGRNQQRLGTAQPKSRQR